MTSPDPMDFIWWLASRAAGVVALLCITVSVGVGLAMAGRVSRRPALARNLMSIHQQTALIGLVAIAVHGITLLGDKFLSPSLGDIVLPFTSSFKPLWTGLGVTAGWLGAILGLSFWIRHRVGPGLWRRLHRATILVYVLSVAHTLGAGTDASEPWMRMLLLTTGAPILFLFAMRVLTPPAAGAFHRYRVSEVTIESNTVCSFELVPARRRGRLAPHQPGQSVTLRAEVPGIGPVSRSYSLSDRHDGRRLRISVKREDNGVMSEHLHAALDPGSTCELAGPGGSFVLGEHGTRPVVLISAGIGATPVLAMLTELAAVRSPREVWWIHGARNGREHPFRGEARQLAGRLPNGRLHVRYSRPDRRDVLGRDFDAEGRLDAGSLIELGMPLDAEFRICGPNGLVADLKAGLSGAGVDAERIRSESFGGTPGPRPAAKPAAAAAAASGPGPSVGFQRSGLTATWEHDTTSLLELAEANGVPAAFGCRIGSCHSCRADVLVGAVRHDPEPLEPPAAGVALLCCAVPDGDVVLDA